MIFFMLVSVLNQNRMVMLDFLLCCLLVRRLTIVSKWWPTLREKGNPLGSAEEFDNIEGTDILILSVTRVLGS